MRKDYRKHNNKKKLNLKIKIIQKYIKKTRRRRENICLKKMKFIRWGYTSVICGNFDLLTKLLLLV